MHKTLFLLLLSFFVLLLASCKKDIEVPAYIHIKNSTFISKGGQGTSLQNFSHVGVFVNDNLEGIFETPVTFPILKKGPQRIEIRPYIKRIAREGLVIYTMGNGYAVASVNLTEAKTDTISPLFEYETNTKFVWLDNFDNNTKTLKKVSGTLDTILLTKTKGAGIDTSLYCYLSLGTVKNSFFEIETEDAFKLPLDGRDVYMEFHYKTNIPFTVGLIEINGNGDRVALPSVSPFSTNGNWQKGYIYLNDELLGAPSNAKYKVFITALNGDVNIVPEIYLDNLKLLYRE